MDSTQTLISADDGRIRPEKSEVMQLIMIIQRQKNAGRVSPLFS